MNFPILKDIGEDLDRKDFDKHGVLSGNISISRWLQQSNRKEPQVILLVYN